jgi:hypothetical protein
MTSLPIDSAGDFQGVGGGKVNSLSQTKKRSAGWWIMGFIGMLAPATLTFFALRSMLKPTSYNFSSPDYIMYEPSSVNPLVFVVAGVVVMLFVFIALLDLGVFGPLSIGLVLFSVLIFLISVGVGSDANEYKLKTWLNSNEGLSVKADPIGENSILRSFKSGGAISYTEGNGEAAYGFFSEVSENKYMFTRLAPVEE